MSVFLNDSDIFLHAIAEHISVIQSLSSQKPVLHQVAAEMTRALLHGNKVVWCGNGGSAADAQHLAAELIGRFKRERPGLPSIALTTDTSVLTAIANDYGFEEIFRRQVEALVIPGDVVVGISTSGNSGNVCAALKASRKQQAFTVALTGATGGHLGTIADAVVCIQSQETARIQEAHIVCGHILCEWVELDVCRSLKNLSDVIAR